MFFKFGCPPESTLIISIVILIIAHAIRIWTLTQVVTFSVKDYFLKFIFPALIVVVLSIIPALFIQSLIQHEWMQFLTVCFVSFLCIGLCGYYIVLTSTERSQLVSIILKKIHFNG